MVFLKLVLIPYQFWYDSRAKDKRLLSQFQLAYVRLMVTLTPRLLFFVSPVLNIRLNFQSEREREKDRHRLFYTICIKTRHNSQAFSVSVLKLDNVNNVISFRIVWMLKANKYMYCKPGVHQFRPLFALQYYFCFCSHLIYQ